ncbi:hypothetical protein ACMFMG_010811 [Clarireedia jacksonii]
MLYGCDGIAGYPDNCFEISQIHLGRSVRRMSNVPISHSLEVMQWSRLSGATISFGRCRPISSLICSIHTVFSDGFDIPLQQIEPFPTGQSILELYFTLLAVPPLG